MNSDLPSTPAIVKPAPVQQAKHQLAQRIIKAKKKHNLDKANWKKLTWPEKEVKAQEIAQGTWQAASKIYGQEGQPMPSTRFGDTEGAGGLGWNKMEKDPHVTLPTSVVASLAKPKDLQYEPKVKANARATLLHEWAHYFQNPTLWKDPNKNHIEEAAQLLASYFGHKLFGSEKMTKRGAVPYGNRPRASRELAEVYGPGYWKNKQFE